MRDNIEDHIWHPYSSVSSTAPLYHVERCEGVRITIRNPKGGDPIELIDGMSSWWAAIHGYNHPALNRAASEQLSRMSHVMFGGFTHSPAQQLADLLLEILPSNGEEQSDLSHIFFSDSGSVSVEVAMKMAIQYWGGRKSRFATVRSGYHGDTWNAMGVCDPVTGMHGLFGSSLPINYFADAPEPYAVEMESVEQIFERHAHEIAAFIIEPVVQGAGGMRFYPAEYLCELRKLCDRYDVLLIYDEIATGFGRTGELFATHHTAKVNDGRYALPDIITLGKGLVGGYMTLAATICSPRVAQKVCSTEAGVFMHGPTFMANPLACAVACESIRELRRAYNDLQRIKEIEAILGEELSSALELDTVGDVRVLGAIGVVEMKRAVDLTLLQPLLVERGVWLRPFGRLVYMMPPYIISNEELRTLCRSTLEALREYARL